MGACMSSAKKVAPPSKHGSPKKSPERPLSREGSPRRASGERARSRENLRTEAQTMVHTLDDKIQNGRLEHVRGNFCRNSLSVSTVDSSEKLDPTRPSSWEPKEETEEWGARRKLLCHGDMTIQEFCQELKLPAQKVRAALTFFQLMDTDRNGVISKEEFAAQMHLSQDDVKVGYALSSVDSNGDELICFREVLVAAAHCLADAPSEFVARFCFKMVDRESKEVVSYAALHKFFMDTLYPETEAPATHDKKLHNLMQDDMGLDLDEKVTERDFVLIFERHHDHFRPMLQMWKSLCNMFKGAFTPTFANHTFLQVETSFCNGGVVATPEQEEPSIRPRSAEGFGKRVVSFDKEHEWGYMPEISSQAGSAQNSRTHSYSSDTAQVASDSPGELRTRVANNDGKAVQKHASMANMGSTNWNLRSDFSATFGGKSKLASSFDDGEEEEEEDQNPKPTRNLLPKINKPRKSTSFGGEEIEEELDEKEMEIARARMGRRPKSAEVSARRTPARSFGAETVLPKPRRFEQAAKTRQGSESPRRTTKRTPTSPELGYKKTPIGSFITDLTPLPPMEVPLETGRGTILKVST